MEEDSTIRRSADVGFNEAKRSETSLYLSIGPSLAATSRTCPPLEPLRFLLPQPSQCGAFLAASTGKEKTKAKREGKKSLARSADSGACQAVGVRRQLPNHIVHAGKLEEGSQAARYIIDCKA